MSNNAIDTSKVSFVTVTEANDGQRVDNFLLSVLRGVPKQLVYRIVRKGEVRVNKGRVKADTCVHIGDLVRIPPIRLPERAPIPDIEPKQAQELKNAIIYEDEDRKSTRLNSSHVRISYAVFCLKKKKKK